MEHQEAIETYAAEGYLLDELTDAERDDFEQHFADCESCFADVRDGVRFIHALPEVVEEDVQHQPHGSRWAEMATAAGIAIALTAGVAQVAFIEPMRAQMARERADAAQQRTQLAQARQLGTEVKTYVMPLLDARSAPPEPPTIERGRPFKLLFDLPLRAVPPFTCTIVDERGEAVSSVVLTAKQGPDGAELVGGALGAGNYKLRVTDAQKSVYEVGFRVP